MRPVDIYNKTFLEVYSSCVEGISDQVKVGFFNAEFPGLQDEVDHYEKLARTADLYQIAAEKSRLTDLVRGALTREDLKNLYEVNMVGTAKVARDHYDRILLSPVHKKCPYCSLGQATTLDHYLPKSRFPQFSVSVSNLVPSCKDCQAKKGRDYAANKVTQTLHPYFDLPAYFSESWVKARLSRGDVLGVEFYTSPPAAWTLAMKSRVEAHFSGHNLAKRFAVEAASELVSVNGAVADMRLSGDYAEIRVMLERLAKGHINNCVNSWQSAFYASLAEDTWYCSSPVV